MMETQPTSRVWWTRERAAFLAIGCLLAGIAGGWCLRSSRTATPHSVTIVADAGARSSPAAVAQAAPLSDDSAQLKQMADAQAAPLRDKLEAAPGNPELLASIGNLYYDARAYPVAVDYYARSLKARPSDAAVRTDMGTAFWYMGDPDRAIQEFNKALSFAPNNPNTLFNLGLVQWKGKHDAAGATATWKKLLATDPGYEQKDQVEEMLAEIRKAPGTNQAIATAR